MKPYYAYEAFPWADIDKSWSVDGFITQRWSTHRQAWGRVLSGTDEQLIEAAEQFGIVSPENNAMTIESVRAFYRFKIEMGFVDELLSSREIRPADLTLCAFREGCKQ